MHNLAREYCYDFSLIHREDDDDFYRKYKDYEPTIKHFRD